MPTREVAIAILQSGRQALAQGRFDRAINLFRRVQEGYPDSPERPEATLLLAQALEASGEVGSAISEYRRLNSEFPQAPQAVLARAKIPELERRAVPPLPAVSRVVGVYVRSSRLETIDERELMRVRQSGANTLVVEIARNRGMEKRQAGVYFKTDWAPVLKDRLASVVREARRQGIQVWAAMSMRRMDWIDPALDWSDWRYSLQTLELVRGETVDLLHPAVPEYLVGLLSDLAAAGVNGILLAADPYSAPEDGFSPHALRRYTREIGSSPDPSRFQLAQSRERLGFAPEFWRWVGWKQREQLKIIDGVFQAVRKAYPQLKIAIEIHPESVTAPRVALAWYAEDLLDLRRYRFDYVAFPLSSASEPWLNKLKETVRGERLLLLAESPEASRAQNLTLPAGSGLIYKEKPEPIGLTNQGR
jgi:tetratricopeptide (TPR) repeat protein